MIFIYASIVSSYGYYMLLSNPNMNEGDR